MYKNLYTHEHTLNVQFAKFTSLHCVKFHVCYSSSSLSTPNPKTQNKIHLNSSNANSFPREACTSNVILISLQFCAMHFKTKVSHLDK